MQVSRTSEIPRGHLNSGDSRPLPAAASVSLAGVILLANRFCDGSQLLNPASGVQGIFIRHGRVEQVAKSDSDNGRETGNKRCRLVQSIDTTPSVNILCAASKRCSKTF